jgi:hypothetical protein
VDFVLGKDHTAQDPAVRRDDGRGRFVARGFDSQYVHINSGDSNSGDSNSGDSNCNSKAIPGMSPQTLIL